MPEYPPPSPEYRSPILDSIASEVASIIANLTRKQEEYYPTDNSKEKLIDLSYESRIIHLRAFAYLVLETVRRGGSLIPLSIDDPPFDIGMVEGQTITQYLLSLFENLKREAAEEAIEAGKQAGVNDFMELLVPARFIGQYPPKLYFYPWQGESLMRNPNARASKNGTYILYRETRIPDVVMAYYLTSEDESPERILIFPLGEQFTPPSSPQ